MYDLIIIGGGPAGYVGAERAATGGLKTLLFEGSNLGGVCLNEGCMPTKSLLHSAHLYANAKGGASHGVESEGIVARLDKIVARKDRVVRRLVGGVAMKLRNAGVEVIKEWARVVKVAEGGIEIEAAGQIYRAKNLLIATGSRSSIPPIKGVKESANMVTNRELLTLTEMPRSLVIIGGGVIGIEFAEIFIELGSQVTVIEMLPEILPTLAADLSAKLRAELEKKGVKFELSARVESVDGDKIYYVDANKEATNIVGDKILVSVGRSAIMDGVGLENTEIERDGRAIKVDEKMRTSVTGIYAAGDVTAKNMLAHVASRQAEVAVNTILGVEDSINYDAIPAVIYTSPEYASVGISALEARGRGIEFKELELPMSFAGRFMIESDRVDGVCKVVVNKQRVVIGMQILGNPASELIFGGAMAIELGLTLGQLRKVVFPHPTVSEIIRDVAHLD